MKHRFFALASVAGVLVGPASAYLYTNDFEGAVGSEWSSSSTSTTPVGARKFLGEFNNQTVTLTLTGVPTGPVTLSFDLFVLKSWDGNQGGVGPDRFTLTGDSNTLLDTTFANTEEFGYTQSYPDAYLAGSYAAGTGSDEYNSLGYTFYGDSVYSFDGSGSNAAFTFNNTNSTLVITFQGSSLQDISDESWGIDNVMVRADAVPEPTSMAALALGAATLLRRRRR